MNTTLGVRVGSTTAQETIQTGLLIIFSIVGTWIGLFKVPWRVSGDPCIVAAACTVAVTTALWLTRWQESRGVILERYLVAGFLAYMPVVYVMRYLSAPRGSAVNNWFWVEVLNVVIFVSFAVLGMKRSPWFLAIGTALHGVAWDSWHYRNSSYMPDWYIVACLAVDLTLGAYVASRVPAYLKAARAATQN